MPISIARDGRFRYLQQIAGFGGGGGGGGGTVDSVARADATQALADAFDAQATADAALAAATPADDVALFEGTASDGFITPDGLTWANGRFLITYQTDDPGDINTYEPGDTFIVMVPGAGDFTGHDGQLARVHDTGSGLVWIYYTPRTGDMAYLAGSATNYQYISGTWLPFMENVFNDLYGIAGDAATEASAAIDLAESLESAIDSLAGSLGNITGLFTFTSVNNEALTADQDDFTPFGWYSQTLFTLTPDAAYDITGLTYTTGGRVVILGNVGAFNITLTHDDFNSAADNRFKFKGGTDRVLLPNEFIMLVHVGAWCEIG